MPKLKFNPVNILPVLYLAAMVAVFMYFFGGASDGQRDKGTATDPRFVSVGSPFLAIDHKYGGMEGRVYRDKVHDDCYLLIERHRGPAATIFRDYPCPKQAVSR